MNLLEKWCFDYFFIRRYETHKINSLGSVPRENILDPIKSLRFTKGMHGCLVFCFILFPGSHGLWLHFFSWCYGSEGFTINTTLCAHPCLGASGRPYFVFFPTPRTFDSLKGCRARYPPFCSKLWKTEIFILWERMTCTLWFNNHD